MSVSNTNSSTIFFVQSSWPYGLVDINTGLQDTNHVCTHLKLQTARNLGYWIEISKYKRGNSVGKTRISYIKKSALILFILENRLTKSNQKSFRNLNNINSASISMKEYYSLKFKQLLPSDDFYKNVSNITIDTAVDILKTILGMLPLTKKPAPIKKSKPIFSASQPVASVNTPFDSPFNNDELLCEIMDRTAAGIPNKKVNHEKTSTLHVVRDFDKEKQITKKSIHELLVPNNLPEFVPNSSSDERTLIDFISKSVQYKSDFYKIADTKWKLLVRSVLRGQNVLLVGDKGEGKTMACHAVAKSLNRRIETFNFGNMQDAQTALIGKTSYEPNKGTFFSKSPFVDAITTPDTIILLDEFSRSSDDGYNIMFPVLDANQRYLRLTDENNSPKVKVAPGVCFIATANIGREYSATRHIDAAIMDRFTAKIEVDRLTVEDQSSILNMVQPSLTKRICSIIATMVHRINDFVYGVTENKSDAKELTKPISTRSAIEIANMIHDGFSLQEAIDNIILPEYDSDGGTQSERTFVKQTIQGYITEFKLSDIYQCVTEPS